MASGDTKTNQYLDIAANGSRADLPTDTCCETRTQTLIRGVAERIMDVEDEVERLENNPDVVDIVDTYADLQAYSTSGLTDKDVIRVITDETKGGLSSYYRWNSPDPGWNFVGVIPGGGGIKELSSADYNYPTANPDRVALWLLDNGLYTAPAGVMVAASTTSYPWYNTSDKTILVGGSDTVKGIYTFLNGKTDVVTTQASDGTEADEYTLLKSTQVLQATGQSTTDTMSQKAITDALASVSGGGVIELTSEDYNYDLGSTGTNNCVAMWTLDAGIYSTEEGTAVIFNNAESVVTSQNSLITVSDSLYNSTDAKTFTNVSWISASAVYGYSYGITNATNGNYIVPMESPLVRRREVSQSAGNNNALIMSQNAVTSMVFADPNTRKQIRIGSTVVTGNNSVAIGTSANGSYPETVAIGYGAGSGSNEAVSIGKNTQAFHRASVALGAYSKTSAQGQVDISTLATTNTLGYNNSQYRLLTGLYDPQSDHDAATKGYVDPSTDSSAPTSSTVGRLGEIRIDTSTSTAYMCVSVDDATPAYGWKQITA